MEPMSFKRPLIITAVLATLLVATGVSIDALTFAPLGLLAAFYLLAVTIILANIMVIWIPAQDKHQTA